MMPKFWAGEAFVRASKLPGVRRFADSLVNGPAMAWLNKTIAVVLGDNRHEASRAG